MKTSSVYTHLVNTGPSTAEELPYRTLNPQVKQDGVRTFKPRANSDGPSQQGGGRKTPIYYIEGKHAPKAVIRAWLDANESTVDAVSAWALHRRFSEYGEGFKEASREVLGVSGNGGSGPKNTGVTDMACPFCGDPDIESFPKHRPECPEL